MKKLAAGARRKIVRFLVFSEFNRAINTFPWTSYPGEAFYLSFPLRMWDLYPQEARNWRMPYLRNQSPHADPKDLTDG